jgi:hypothetical protein
VCISIVGGALDGSGFREERLTDFPAIIDIKTATRIGLCAWRCCVKLVNFKCRHGTGGLRFEIATIRLAALGSSIGELLVGWLEVCLQGGRRQQHGQP